MIKKIEAIYSGLMKIIIIITAILSLLMISLIFAQVMARYVFLSPIRWSDILARILLAYIGMGGAVVMLYKRREPRLYILANSLSPRRRAQLEVVVNVISLVFCVVLLIPTQGILASATRGSLPFLPLTWFHLLIGFPVSMFFICLVLLHNIIQAWTESKVHHRQEVEIYQNKKGRL